jgi:hypothetical protein
MFSRRALPVLVGLVFLSGVSLLGQVGCNSGPTVVVTDVPHNGDAYCDDDNACTLDRFVAGTGCVSRCAAPEAGHPCCLVPACWESPVCTPVEEPGLYGTLHNGVGNPSTLVRLDPDTGDLLETVGDVGYAVNGLTWDATTQTLYASTTTWDPLLHSGLLTIDLGTGAGTPVGTGSGLSRSIACLTANSLGDLYGWYEPVLDDLVLWDKVAGTAAVVGEAGLNTGGLGLAFDGADVLYLVNYDGRVYTLDSNTGATTYTGVNLGVMAHHGVFRPLTDSYYGIDEADWGSTDLRNILVVDLTSGTIEATLPTVDRLHTLAFVPD